MLQLGNDSVIYVFSPANTATGGVELLHQVVDYLRENKKKAYIYYYNDIRADIPKAYQHYNIETIDCVDDSAQNVILLPEVAFYFMHQYKYTQKILWWLSVDNYFLAGKTYVFLKEIFGFSFSLGCKAIYRRLYALVCKGVCLPKVSTAQIAKLNYLNVYQSEYARLFLLSKGINNLLPLKDYINTSFEVDSFSYSNRKPNILYNPMKGIAFTRKIMQLSPDLNFIPLQNLSRTELVELFQKSMLYIDFGNHPGKDRLPREAVMNGCCIVTGKRGASTNNIDIPINEQLYKFDEREAKLQQIVSRIREILANYEECVKDFDAYREGILKEKAEFFQQIDAIFQLSGK